MKEPGPVFVARLDPIHSEARHLGPSGAVERVHYLSRSRPSLATSVLPVDCVDAHEEDGHGYQRRSVRVDV